MCNFLFWSKILCCYKYVLLHYQILCFFNFNVHKNVTTNFNASTLLMDLTHQLLLGWSNKNHKMGGTCSRHEGKIKLYTGFWWGNLNERGHLEYLSLFEIMIYKRTVKRQDGKVWTGLICLGTGTGGWLLWTRHWTFGWYKMSAISWIAEKVSISQEGFCSVN